MDVLGGTWRYIQSGLLLAETHTLRLVENVNASMLVRKTVATLDIVAGGPGIVQLGEAFLDGLLRVHIESILAFLDVRPRRALLLKYSLNT